MSERPVDRQRRLNEAKGILRGYVGECRHAPPMCMRCASRTVMAELRAAEARVVLLEAQRETVRREIALVLPKLALSRGQKLTKADELGLEWACEMLERAADLCSICGSLDTREYRNAVGFPDWLCDEHADLAAVSVADSGPAPGQQYDWTTPRCGVDHEHDSSCFRVPRAVSGQETP